jgi:pseudaminic acid cytidylyltransferase
MKNIATFILARAGSKRIPKKNIIRFCGKPLVEWSLQTAWALGYPVWVFTDFPEVAEIAKTYHATVRPKLFEREDGHHETGKEIIEYNKEVRADHIILLQPTSPRRNAELIKKWIEKFLVGDFDVGFAAEYLRPGFYYDAGGAPISFFEQYRNYDGDLKTHIWRESGSFYIFKASQAEKNHIIAGENRIIFHDPIANNDIDFEEDMEGDS